MRIHVIVCVCVHTHLCCLNNYSNWSETHFNGVTGLEANIIAKLFCTDLQIKNGVEDVGWFTTINDTKYHICMVSRCLPELLSWDYCYFSS